MTGENGKGRESVQLSIHKSPPFVEYKNFRRSAKSAPGLYPEADSFRQHRTMGTAGFGGSFAPIAQHEKWEIHPVFPHFSCFRLCQNLSPNLLAPLCGAALGKRDCGFPQPLYKRHRSLGPPSYSSKIMSSRSPGSTWRESISKAPFKKTIGQYIPFPAKNVTIFLDNHK